MKTENKNRSKKIPKKGFFLPEELREIQLAMDEEGYTSFSDYVVNMTKTRRIITDAEQRRKQMYSYRYAKIQTLHNKLMTNVDVPNTMKAIMMEVDALCRDLV